MNSRIIPISRLSIVFILAVVISGSILTWFSINSISNLKELTEKKILEEQRDLATKVANHLHVELQTLTDTFSNGIISFELLKDSLRKAALVNDYITQPFIFSTNRGFLYPNFEGVTENFSAVNHSDRYKSVFRRGQEAEFVKQDLQLSKKHYLACLDLSVEVKDSVKALNALARVSIKLKEYEIAVSHYKVIILNYFHEADQNGQPYVYYALTQLLKITETNNIEDIVPLVEFCLEKIENGLIPMNPGMEELNGKVKEWIQKIITINPVRLSSLEKLTKCIDQQIQFIREYRNEIMNITNEENLFNHLLVGNGFKVVSNFSDYSFHLLLVNTNFKQPIGFLIDGKKILDSIPNSVFLGQYEFDYKIEFPVENSVNATTENLTYTSQLNPYYPHQKIQIKIEDENLINNFVKRRSWIYGIATALLLLAMSLGVVLILRDVRRERRLMRLRSDFISNVTHELKTPLTSIYMFAESLLLKRIKKEEDRDEYLSIILKESERLKRMINNILEFSKMEKGKSEYHFVDSNLSAILYNAIHDLDYWFEKEKFEVVIELDEDINAEVDPEKIKQVISNLLSNAIKYSTENKKISIRLFKTSDDINLEIEDKGIGISEPDLSRIFEKYFRVDNKENISGTGLGLTVVKEIIEAHNGSISVTSEIDKGSKFSITLNQQITEA